MEQRGVNYIFGLARNQRLEQQMAPAIAQAKSLAEAAQAPQRVFSDFPWQTKNSWIKPRRVVGKAEWLCGSEGSPKANPRFVVTDLEGEARALYEELYCQRGEMENQINA
jgi:hypothetical protein